MQIKIKQAIKYFGYQTLNEHDANKINVACIFECISKIKKLGSVTKILKYKPKLSNIHEVSFSQTFMIHVTLFPKNVFQKYNNCLKISFEYCKKNSYHIRKTALLNRRTYFQSFILLNW